jgi:hypothetical protein
VIDEIAIPSEQELVAEYFARAEVSRGRTAFHEGGHVAAGAWFRHSVRGATIKATATYFGITHLGRQIPTADLEAARVAIGEGRSVLARTRRRVEEDVIVTYMGDVAKQRAIELGLVDPEPVYPPPADEREASEHKLTSMRERIALWHAADTAGLVRTMDDAHQASRLTREVSTSDSQAEAYAGWLKTRTWALVEVPAVWAMVVAIADALVERETLSGRACRTILEEVRR